jgi:hypothetical protein
MILETVASPGQKGTGAGREAFQPGVRYVCGKAARIELRNLSSNDWQNAAPEMLLTSELSKRTKKPYHHLVLSWHEHEQPTDDQMFEAMNKMIKALGLEEYQAVIGSHHDRTRKHIHAVCNTVHPTTGLAWSKSNDWQKAEQACRQIEYDQGWSHDRGRFDFDMVENDDGMMVAELKPNPAAWAKKVADRESGKRPKSSGDIKFEKSSGFETFEHGIPDALKEKFGQVVSAATDWQSLHLGLNQIGMTYEKFGSGARVGLVGSTEYVKASAFGSKFSITRIEKLFSTYEARSGEYANELKEDHIDNMSMTGRVSDEDLKATKSEAFKMTLLRRIYTEIHVDPAVCRAIRFVDMVDKPAQITFHDGSTVVDDGSRVSASMDTDVTRATIIAIAKAKGWTSVRLKGKPEFINRISLEFAKEGITVKGLLDDLQVKCDQIIEQTAKARRRIDAEVAALARQHQESLTDRDQALSENQFERDQMQADKTEISEEVQAVIDAIGGGHDAVSTAFRAAARDEGAAKVRDLPDARTVQKPQSAPDLGRQDAGGKRRIQSQILENDRNEIDAMKAVDIAHIAALGGWFDVSKTHKDSSDRSGKRYQIFQRGGDTIKASLIGDTWLWKSNKTGESGSVIDLWLHDNPGKNLGHARAAFREMTGASPKATPAPARKAPPPDDHTAARQRWEEAPYIEGRRSYAEDRGISRQTIEKFGSEVRSGAFGGIYFAHRNERGDIQGFEQRWEKDGEKNKARFAKGGRKTVSILGDPNTATRMVLLEGGLDSLALAQIENRKDTIYVSTGGGFGPETETAIKRLAVGRATFSGFDNDKAGSVMDKRLSALIDGVQRHAPPATVAGSDRNCNDWLDVLNAQKESRSMKIDAEKSEVATHESESYDPKSLDLS